MADTLLAAARNNVSRTFNSLPSNVGVVLGLAGVPYFLFYILKDHGKIGTGLFSVLPGSASTHTRSILTIVADSFGRYVRSSFTLSAIIGAMDLVGLLIIRAPLAPLLAVVAAVCELVPIVGAWTGAIISVPVTLALAPDKAIWVVAVMLVARLAENLFIAPRIQSAYFRVHPAITTVLLTVGTYLAGIWGMIFTMPLAASVLGVVQYCSDYASRDDPTRTSGAENHQELLDHKMRPQIDVAEISGPRNSQISLDPGIQSGTLDDTAEIR